MVLCFKIARRPRTTPKSQDLSLNKTRNLQKFAPGPDLAARAKRLEITFIYRKGAEGPPTFTRGPVRARARARARAKHPGEKKFYSQPAASGPKMQAKNFFEKIFQKKIFSPKFKKIINKFFKTLCFPKPRDVAQKRRTRFRYNRRTMSCFITFQKILKMKPEVDIFKNTQFYPTEGWSFFSKSNVALDYYRKPRI